LNLGFISNVAEQYIQRHLRVVSAHVVPSLIPFLKHLGQVFKGNS